MNFLKNNEKNIQYGDWHVHTNYTDGKSTIFEYCNKAEENSLKFIAFTEHVRKKLSYSYDDFLSEISSAKDKFGIEILSGCEAKVLNLNGELDVSEDVLKQCEVVIGVFHSFKWKDKRNYLITLEALLKNPIVDIWGHPTLFAKKHNIKLEENDLKEIITVCKENNVLIERNFKYGLPDINFMKLAISKGAKFVVGSDAHNINELLTIDKLKEEWNWVNKMY